MTFSAHEGTGVGVDFNFIHSFSVHRIPRQAQWTEGRETHVPSFSRCSPSLDVDCHESFHLL